MDAQTLLLTLRHCIIFFKDQEKMGKLLHDFSFLPTQVLGMAFSTFRRGGSVPCSTVSADLQVKPVLLR